MDTQRGLWQQKVQMLSCETILVHQGRQRDISSKILSEASSQSLDTISESRTSEVEECASKKDIAKVAASSSRKSTGLKNLKIVGAALQIVDIR